MERGSGAVAATGTLPADAELLGLGIELNRLKRRCGHQRALVRRLDAELGDICHQREIDPWRPDGGRNPAFDKLLQELGCATAWQRWTMTLSASLELADRIEKLPARTVAGLEVRFRAILWRLTYDDDLLDDKHRRALRAFGRAMTKAAEV